MNHFHSIIPWFLKFGIVLNDDDALDFLPIPNALGLTFGLDDLYPSFIILQEQTETFRFPKMTRSAGVLYQ